MTANFHVHGIDHVELYVPDLYEAARWYGKVFGLDIVKEFEHWAQDSDGPLMISPGGAAQGTKLALFKGPPQGNNDPVGIRRIAFGVDGAAFLHLLDTLEHLDLRAASARRITRRDAVDHDLSFSIYFTDPWGNRFEVTTYDHEPVRARLNH